MWNIVVVEPGVDPNNLVCQEWRTFRLAATQAAALIKTMIPRKTFGKCWTGRKPKLDQVWPGRRTRLCTICGSGADGRRD